MYTMTHNGRPLYDPRATQYSLESPILHLEANKIATLEFTIYPNNPEYSGIVLRQSIIRLYRDGTIYMLFRPVKRRLNFHGGMEFTCEEMTAMLNDFLHRPAAFNGTVRELMQLCIQTFNSQSMDLEVIAPAAYIRSLSLTQETAKNLYRQYAGKIREHNNATGETIEHDYGYGKNAESAVLCNILAVLGYFGNVYLPPGTSYKNAENALMAYTADKGIRYGYYNAGNNISYDGHGWAETIDKGAVIRELRADLADLQAQLPEDPADDDEWDNQHGSQAAVSFLLGELPVAGGDTMDLDAGDYKGYWDYMQDSIVGQFDGYIVPEWGESTCTLSYCKEDELPICSQSIEFSQNMSDIFVDTDSDKIYSIIIPIGKDNITIKEVEGQNDYLASEAAIGLYGKKEITKDWPEISTSQELRSVASQWLVDNAIRLRDEITVSAYDLKYAGVASEYLEFLSRVPIISQPLGISELCPLTSADLSLDSPIYDIFSLNGERDSISDIINAKK